MKNIVKTSYSTSYLLAALCVGLLNACMSTTQDNLKPALLAEPSAQTSMVIEKAITQLLHGQPVKLADDVFANDNIVTVERVEHVDQQGKMLNGRSNENVQTFSLLTDHDLCYLRHEATKKTIALTNLPCVKR